MGPSSSSSRSRTARFASPVPAACAELDGLARYLGALLGAAHRRGRAGDFARWSSADTSAISERAVELSGLHEAVYLELCWLSRSGATSLG